MKGRIEGAPIFTVTKNEILTALNKPDQYLLALVAVAEDDGTDVRYLRQPFKGEDAAFFDVTSVNYEWTKLFDRGEVPT